MFRHEGSGHAADVFRDAKAFALQQGDLLSDRAMLLEGEFRHGPDAVAERTVVGALGVHAPGDFIDAQLDRYACSILLIVQMRIWNRSAVRVRPRHQMHWHYTTRSSGCGARLTCMDDVTSWQRPRRWGNWRLAKEREHLSALLWSHTFASVEIGLRALN